MRERGWLEEADEKGGPKRNISLYRPTLRLIEQLESENVQDPEVQDPEVQDPEAHAEVHEEETEVTGTEDLDFDPTARMFEGWTPDDEAHGRIQPTDTGRVRWPTASDSDE
jgi:hypothetical protein